jgi:MoaA/NifB/PqqE/SkfB family radical SAM enzyme
MTEGYKKLIHGKPAYEEYFVINWCFFNICNFSCSYCPDNLHSGKNRGLPIEVVQNFCQQVFQEKKDKKIFFEFTGGEVTYYRDFAKLMTYIKEQGGETGLISNGSRDLKFWEDHKHLIDHICLSFHPEQGDKDHFFEVVKLLNSVTTVHVNIMMLPEKFDELHKLANRIASEIEGPSVAIQALFQGMSGTMFNYSTEQKKILDNPEFPWGTNLIHRRSAELKRNVYRGEMLKVLENGSMEMANPPELIAREENDWYGWKCHIGLENLVIDYTGNIRRGWCNVGGIIGNVQDDVFCFPKDPIVCSARKCFCGLDIMSTKERV